MYIVEVFQMNRITKCRIRTPDYERASDVFARAKSSQLRELRLFKVSSSDRVLLKYLIKVRTAPTGPAQNVREHDEILNIGSTDV